MAAEAHFSLFDGDRLNRLFAVLHAPQDGRFCILKRCAIVVMLTWVPVAVLAVCNGLFGGGMVTTNFFADFAAHAQFLIAMPLFMLAEPIAEVSTRTADRQFIDCGIIRAQDMQKLHGVHVMIRRLRLSVWPEIAFVAIAYALSLAILVPEFSTQPLPTWHVKDYTHWRTLTAAGAWEFLIALPVLNYTWLRFVWKIVMWTVYLKRVSRLRLELHPAHPDLTGGIGFISATQGRFAVFILAYGISNIAATVGYEIAILHYDLSAMPVWGPLVGFAIIAPLLFTLPLLMFTAQLYRSKQRALSLYRERVTEHSRVVEKRWLERSRGAESAVEEVRELTELSALGTMFTRIETMRVVPFDLRSFGQLLGSSLGSIAVLLPLLHANANLTGIFDAIGKLLGHLAGH
ncbi:MAG TPA: hypothetical protein VGM97_08790 [Steroidobacteraceae bacterium]